MRRRYRAEWRFQAYGLVALTLTTLFLAVLIADVLVRGLPAFWSYSVVLNVPVKEEEIDPDNKRTVLAGQVERLNAERRSWLGRWLLGPNEADRAADRSSRSAPATTSALPARPSTMRFRASRGGRSAASFRGCSRPVPAIRCAIAWPPMSA